MRQKYAVFLKNTQANFNIIRQKTQTFVTRIKKIARSQA